MSDLQKKYEEISSKEDESKLEKFMAMYEKFDDASKKTESTENYTLDNTTETINF